MNFDINKRFSLLQNLTEMVVIGVTPSLVITGEGGLGKTHLVKSVIGDWSLDESDYVFFSGYSTSRGLYNTLFDNNGKLIVFDDCDSVLEDKVSLNILKSALDSYDKRTISWMAKMTKGDEYPSQFDFTGRVIFISNKSKQSIDGAILSRSLSVDLTMTKSEKIGRMSHILPRILPEIPIEFKKEALEFLESVSDDCSLNLRTLIMVSKMRFSNSENWRDMAQFMLMS